MNSKSNKKNSNQSLGAYLSHSTIENGILIEANNAKAFITIYSDEIIRIRITQEDTNDFSYALVATPIATKFSVSETATEISLSTVSVELVIQKSALRFSFFDANNNLLNEDDTAFGTSWIGTEMTTYKRLQEGERFIGLGEKTGNLD